MLLPVFSLKDAIQDYNAISTKKYSLTTDFGCLFFNASMLQNANSAIGLINEGYALFLWSEEELHYHNTGKKIAREIQAYWRGYSSSKPSYSLPSHVESLVETFNLKKAFFDWANRFYEILIQSTSWDTWLSSPNTINKSFLNVLKRKWDEQYIWARFTSRAIHYFAHDLLPDLTRYHQHILNNLWLYYFAMPKEIYTAYKMYLETFLQATHSLKESLVASMLARLEAWDTSSFDNSMPLVHLYQNLKKCGVNESAELKELNKPPEVYETLTSELLTTFYTYIERYGNSKDKERLYLLSWFKNEDTLLSTDTIYTAEGCFLAPTVLIPYIPTTLLKPQWLFRDRVFRHDFFKKRSSLLAQIKLLPNVNNLIININDLREVHRILEQLQHKQSLITQDLMELALNQSSTFSRLWYRKTNRFLTIWQQQLQNQQMEVIQRKLWVAENLGTEIQKQCPSLSLVSHIPWKSFVLLNKILNEIKNDLNHYQFPHLQAQLASVEEKFIGLLATQRVINQLKTLATQEELPRDQINSMLHSIVDFYRIERLRDKESSNAFLDIVKPYLQSMFSQVEALLRTSFFSEENLSIEHDLYRLLDLLSVLCNLKEVDTKKLLQSLITDEDKNNYFSVYLRILHQHTVDNQQEINYSQVSKINAIEDFLNTLLPNYLIGKKTIEEHIRELKDLNAKSLGLLEVHIKALQDELADNCKKIDAATANEIDDLHSVYQSLNFFQGVNTELVAGNLKEVNRAGLRHSFFNISKINSKLIDTYLNLFSSSKLLNK